MDWCEASVAIVLSCPVQRSQSLTSARQHFVHVGSFRRWYTSTSSVQISVHTHSYLVTGNHNTGLPP